MRRILLRGLLLVLFATVLTVPAAPNAAAYGTPFGYWPRSNGNLTFCYSDAVSVAHPGWPSYIRADVTKWNNVSSGPRPKWLQPPGGCAITFDTAALAGNLCGYTTWTLATAKPISYANVKYNSSLSYYRIGQSRGYCEFDWTTLHEFGHANGLSHSSVSTAVMYGSDNVRTSYTSDDIAAIRKNYP